VPVFGAQSSKFIPRGEETKRGGSQICGKDGLDETWITTCAKHHRPDIGFQSRHALFAHGRSSD
jgi:hypothetical protein